MENEPKKTIQQNVLAAIQAGQVKMRPRWHFVLKAALLIVGLALIILASIFVGSFILFLMHQNGTWFAPAFGGPGFRELLTTLPLLLILVSLIFIILLQLLVRRYSFAYGKPALFTVLAIVLVVIAGSFLLEQSHVHEGLFEQAREHNLPVAGGFYRQFGESPASHTTPGLITLKNENGFVMIDPHSHQFIVVITSDTRLPYGENFEVGDSVIVLGERTADTIVATGIREFDPDERMFHPMMPVRN